jgi:hypothetical protein
MILFLILGVVALFVFNAISGQTAVVWSSETPITALMLVATVWFFQAIQLPIYFKFGYTKARMLSILPFFAILAGTMLFMNISDAGRGISQLFPDLASSNLILPLVAVALLAIVLISYKLSAGFYTKREF